MGKDRILISRLCHPSHLQDTGDVGKAPSSSHHARVSFQEGSYSTALRVDEIGPVPAAGSGAGGGFLLSSGCLREGEVDRAPGEPMSLLIIA